MTLSDKFSPGPKPNLPPNPEPFTNDPNYNIDWNGGLKPPSMRFDTVDQTISGVREISAKGGAYNEHVEVNDPAS